MFGKLKRYYWLSLLIPLLVVNNVIVFTPNFRKQYYIVMIIALSLMIYKNSIRRINWLYMGFVGVCLLSILFNDIPTQFQAPLRFITFCSVVFLVTPIIQSPLLIRFRTQAFVVLMHLIVLLVIVSFFASLVGINPMEKPEDTAVGIEARGESGITSQLMIMGPTAGVSLIYCVYILFVQKNIKINFLTKCYFGFGAFCGFAMNLMAVSRAGVAAAAMGLIALLVFKSRFHLGKAMMYAGLLITILVCTYPLWSNYSQKVEAKQEKLSDGTGMFSSRQSLWEKRYEEFKESPVVGIGFCAIDLGDGWTEDDNSSPLSEDPNIGWNGTVETGSGWLMVLSMTGISGFILFVLIFFNCFLTTYRNVKRRYIPPYALFGALLVFFAGHMVAEGYTLAAGSFLFFILWSVLGICQSWNPERKTLSL